MAAARPLRADRPGRFKLQDQALPGIEMRYLPPFYFAAHATYRAASRSACTSRLRLSYGKEPGRMDLPIFIFVVEDEHAIKDLLEDALEEGGFAVSTAANGAQAIQMLEDRDTDYRALVTDVHLPPGELTGWDG